MNRSPGVTLLSMSGLRVIDPALLELGLRLPGIARRSQALAELPPLGLLTLAATIPEQWCVALHTDDGTLSIDDAFASIMETDPDVVAFSTLTPASDRAANLSKRLRHVGIRTLVGGLHAVATPESCTPHFDATAVGDGELLLPRMLQDVRQDDLQRVYHPAETFDLANALTPRWELWEGRKTPRFTLQTMRGCPWACSFCAASRLLGPPRAKPIEKITEELREITARKSRPWIELADDNTFAGDRDHEPMLAALANAKARWFTESDWRIAEHPALLQQIAAAGCRQILIGFESSVFRYPGMAAKTADLQKMTDAAIAIQEAGIVVNACFIVGADGETQQSIDRLGEFLANAPFGEVQLTIQTPFPGTSLYKSLQSESRLLPGDYSRYTLFDVVYQPTPLSVEELTDAFRRIVGQVFGQDSQARRNRIVKNIRAIRRGKKR